MLVLLTERLGKLKAYSTMKVYIRILIGVSVSTGRGHVHCYPYDVDDPMGPLRTSAQFTQDAKDAFEAGLPVSDQTHYYTNLYNYRFLVLKGLLG